MGNSPSSQSSSYSAVSQTETEIEDQKVVSLRRMEKTLVDIENQLSKTNLNDAQRTTIMQGKTQVEMAIKLLKDPDVSFADYQKKMGLTGGSKKHRSKKHRSKKHRSKKHKSRR